VRDFGGADGIETSVRKWDGGTNALVRGMIQKQSMRLEGPMLDSLSL